MWKARLNSTGITGSILKELAKVYLSKTRGVTKTGCNLLKRFADAFELDLPLTEHELCVMVFLWALVEKLDIGKTIPTYLSHISRFYRDTHISVPRNERGHMKIPLVYGFLQGLKNKTNWLALRCFKFLLRADTVSDILSFHYPPREVNVARLCYGLAILWTNGGRTSDVFIETKQEAVKYHNKVIHHRDIRFIRESQDSLQLTEVPRVESTGHQFDKRERKEELHGSGIPFFGVRTPREFILDSGLWLDFIYELDGNLDINDPIFHWDDDPKRLILAEDYRDFVRGTLHLLGCDISPEDIRYISTRRGLAQDATDAGFRDNDLQLLCNWSDPRDNKSVKIYRRRNATRLMTWVRTIMVNRLNAVEYKHKHNDLIDRKVMVHPFPLPIPILGLTERRL